MPKTTATATATPCAHCAGDRAALHADTCPVRATRAIDSALASIEARTRAAIDAQLGAVLRTEPYATTPPPVTHKAPLAELRAMKLQPFAIWTHDGDGYLDVPTIWARDGAAAIRQLAATRDPGAKVTDRHGRAPSARTRELRVVWSSGFDTGLLRADVQVWPDAGERAVGEVDAVDAVSFYSSGGRVLIGTSRGPVHVRSTDVARLVAVCHATVLDAFRWLLEPTPSPAAQLAAPSPLHAAIAFEVTAGDDYAVCTVRAPREVDYRTGRAIVYLLAAKVEALTLRPTWAANVTVDVMDGATAAEGPRGRVTLSVADDAQATAARHQLHAAAAAVLRDIHDHGIAC